jgi:DNA-binding transcriptional ArsR family regulator
MSRKMGHERPALPPAALELVAARFKVLAEPLRLRILQALEAGEMSVTEIAKAVESTQPNVSKHLRLLQDAGLIVRRQEGNLIYCSIGDERVFELCEVVCSSLRQRFASQAGALGLNGTQAPAKRRGVK